MTDLTKLRRLAEQAIASRTEFGDLPIDYEFRVSVDPAAILSLLDELDAAKHVGDNCGRVLEQTAKRVAALEEGLENLANAYARDWGESVDDEPEYQQARQLLQASAQDASEGSD